MQFCIKPYKRVKMRELSNPFVIGKYVSKGSLGICSYP